MTTQMMRPSPRNSGKAFMQFCNFLDDVKKKKKSIILAPDYVVMTIELYESIIGKKSK